MRFEQKLISIAGSVILFSTVLTFSGCSCNGGKSPNTTVPYPTVQPTPTSQPTVNPTSTLPETPTQTTPATTAPFPYQGTGTGNWSGQLTYRNQIIPVSGTMSVSVDANGVFSGSIVSSSGGTAPANIKANVDANGNLTGTVTFVAEGMTFETNWQGKMTQSGKSLSMEGTWTSLYGSGAFSGSGISTK